MRVAVQGVPSFRLQVVKIIYAARRINRLRHIVKGVVNFIFFSEAFYLLIRCASCNPNSANYDFYQRPQKREGRTKQSGANQENDCRVMLKGLVYEGSDRS